MHSFSITYFRFSKNIASVDNIIFNLNWKEWPISGERIWSFVLCSNVLRGLSRVVELKKKFCWVKHFLVFSMIRLLFFLFPRISFGWYFKAANNFPVRMPKGGKVSAG